MTTSNPTPDQLRDLARNAARGAIRQALHQLCPELEAGAAIAGMADDIAGLVGNRTSEPLPAVAEEAGLGVSAAFRYAHNHQARADGRYDGAE